MIVPCLTINAPALCIKVLSAEYSALGINLLPSKPFIQPVVLNLVLTASTKVFNAGKLFSKLKSYFFGFSIRDIKYLTELRISATIYVSIYKPFSFRTCG
jgi:hypothetical protein